MIGVNMTGHIDDMEFPIQCDEKGIGPLWSAFQKPMPPSHHKKNIRSTIIEGHYTKYLTRIPQNCQGYKKLE